MNKQVLILSFLQFTRSPKSTPRVNVNDTFHSSRAWPVQLLIVECEMVRFEIIDQPILTYCVMLHHSPSDEAINDRTLGETVSAAKRYDRQAYMSVRHLSTVSQSS